MTVFMRGAVMPGIIVSGGVRNWPTCHERPSRPKVLRGISDEASVQMELPRSQRDGREAEPT